MEREKRPLYQDQFSPAGVFHAGGRIFSVDEETRSQRKKRGGGGGGGEVSGLKSLRPILECIYEERLFTEAEHTYGSVAKKRGSLSRQ